MCGICGVIGFNGKEVSIGSVENMAMVMKNVVLMRMEWWLTTTMLWGTATEDHRSE